MHDDGSAVAPLSTRALDRLRPVADHVDAFTQRSGRAVVEGDASLAEALLSPGGDRAKIDTALQAAWSDILGGHAQPRSDMTANVSLLVSLERIADLASDVCQAVIGLSSEAPVGDLPSVKKLAELVPEMLRDALGAVRANDRRSAERVLGKGLTVDACFAQAHFDVLQVLAPGTSDLTVVRKFHALSRALELIGDRASEIASSVRGPAAAAFSA